MRKSDKDISSALETLQDQPLSEDVKQAFDWIFEPDAPSDATLIAQMFPDDGKEGSLIREILLDKMKADTDERTD